MLYERPIRPKRSFYLSQLELWRRKWVLRPSKQAPHIISILEATDECLGDDTFPVQPRAFP
jgi:hypothetical protein